METAVIIDDPRPAAEKGNPGRARSGADPVDLFATVLRSLTTGNDLDPARMGDEAGCVGQAGGRRFDIGRHGVLAAGWPDTVRPAVRRHQQAAHFAAHGVIAGAYDIVVAGGVGLMSWVPMGNATPGADAHGSLIGRGYLAGLANQGISAELIVANRAFDCEELDAFAARSHSLVVETGGMGAFKNENVAITAEADGQRPDDLGDETVRPAPTADGLAGLQTMREGGGLANTAMIERL